MITELTQEQKDMIPGFVEEWLKIGLSTEPSDRKATEKAIQNIYTELNLEVPNIVWKNSPIEAIDFLVKEQDVNPSNVLEEVSLWGSHDANWVANYQFFLKIGVTLNDDTARLFDYITTITKSSFWIWMYHELVVCCERPSQLHLDDETPAQLHNENGPAIAFRDDWAIYAIHGVRVPEYVIMHPEKITIEDIKKEQSAEIKRIKRERYGDDRYLKDIGAKVIDTDAHDVNVADICEGRSVARALVEDDEGDRFMIGTDGSTTRVYVMQVPRHVKTCKEAHEELSGFGEDIIVAHS